MGTAYGQRCSFRPLLHSPPPTPQPRLTKISFPDGLSIPFFTISRNVSRTVSISATATVNSARNRVDPEWLLNINWFSGRPGPSRFNPPSTPAEPDVENNHVDEERSMEQTINSHEEMAKTVVGHRRIPSGGGHSGSDHSALKEVEVPPKAMVTVSEAPVIEEDKLTVSSVYRRRTTSSADVKEGEDAASEKGASSASIVALPEVAHHGNPPRAVRFPEGTE